MADHYQIARSIHELDEDRWDALAGDQVVMTHRWQRVMEACRPGYAPRYALLEDRQGPLAAFTADTASTFGRRGLCEALLRRASVVVGAPMSAMHPGVVRRSGLSLEAALPRLEPALRDLCRHGSRPLLCVGNVTTADLPQWQARGFLASAQAAATMLDLSGPSGASYDAYLATLPRRDRHEVGRARRRGADHGVVLTHGPLAGDEGALLYPLLREVFAHHGTAESAMPLTADLFGALARELPGETLLFTGHVGGQLAGFFLCFGRGADLWCAWAGLRYELAYPSSLYFLLIDELVRWSIAHGVRRIHAGLSNERQKARHGFRPRERWFCARATPRPLHAALALSLSGAPSAHGGRAQVGVLAPGAPGSGEY